MGLGLGLGLRLGIWSLVFLLLGLALALGPWPRFCYTYFMSSRYQTRSFCQSQSCACSTWFAHLITLSLGLNLSINSCSLTTCLLYLVAPGLSLILNLDLLPKLGLASHCFLCCGKIVVI